MPTPLKRTDYHIERTRPRRAKPKAFHIRGVDSVVVENFQAYCARSGYTIHQAVEVLMKEAAKRKRLIINARRDTYNKDGSLHVRNIHPDIKRAYVAYCTLYGYNLNTAIEHFMADAVTRRRTLAVR